MFLTRAALIDPRMKRVDPEEQADVAIAWADVLADVVLSDALAALTRLQRERHGGDPVILPGDVLDQVGGVIAPDGLVDETEQLGMRRALAAAGVTEAEYRQHQHDAVWVRAHFPRELEA